MYRKVVLPLVVIFISALGGAFFVLWVLSPLLNISYSPLVRSTGITVEGQVAKVLGDSVTITNGGRTFNFKVGVGTTILKFDNEYGGRLRESSVSAALVSYAAPQKVELSKLKIGDDLSVLLKIKGIKLETVSVYIVPKSR